MFSREVIVITDAAISSYNIDFVIFNFVNTLVNILFSNKWWTLLAINLNIVMYKIFRNYSNVIPLKQNNQSISSFLRKIQTTKSLQYEIQSAFFMPKLSVTLLRHSNLQSSYIKYTYSTCWISQMESCIPKTMFNVLS